MFSKQTDTAVLCLVVCLVMTSAVFAEEIPTRIDGRVIKVDEAARLLTIDFQHPATGEKSVLEFEVGESAGFKDFKRLSSLKEGDLVTLDYLDYKPIPKAIYIVYVPPTKTYFTQKDIAGALLKINKNKKKTDGA